MASRKKVLITYEYFLPAFKAGGPIQSIANLCRQLKNEYQFFVVCGNTDHNEAQPLPNIVSNAWNDFENGTASVFYISKDNFKRATLYKLFKEVNPDYLFINGIFSPFFNIIPLLYGDSKKILSARGMLHSGALTQKSFKKNIYLTVLKLMGVRKKIAFHATDIEEQQYIHNVFGSKTKVLVAQNFSNKNFLTNFITKNAGELRLVSVALISPMKNHALVLEALKGVTGKVQYDIYGPVKDTGYWEECLKIIETLPGNISVKYKGSLEPNMVSNVLTGYHYFILPSKSENFGHAIYEALSSGKPVITSYNTPWNGMEENSAGYNVDINNVNSITKAIQSACIQENEDYQQWSKQAVAVAEKAIDVEKIKSQYRALFN